MHDRNDIVGHIAYSLYKEDKVQFIDKFKQENGREPKESELKPFHDTSCLDGSIQRYKESALLLMQSFFNETLAESTSQIESDYKEHLKQILLPLKTKWWEAILQSFLGALFFAIFLAAVAFVYQNRGSDLPVPSPTEQVQAK